MEYEYRYYEGNVGGGWYCANCGAFVPLNTAHQCPSLPSSTGNDYPFRYFSPTDRELLLKILEKFDEVLKILKDK